MNYKKYREVIGDPENKKKYAEEYPFCEICGHTLSLSIDHHIEQQQIIIEDESNYTRLCYGLFTPGSKDCHGKKKSKKQFLREIKPVPGSKFYGWEPINIWHYLSILKNGETIESIREKYEPS